MPIGFWAVSRKDVIALAGFHLKENHKNHEVTPKDIDKLVRELNEKLDNTLIDTMIDFAEHS